MTQDRRPRAGPDEAFETCRRGSGDAYMSAATDIVVSQIVDRTKGVHGGSPRSISYRDETAESSGRHGPLALPPLSRTVLAAVRALNSEEKVSTDAATILLSLAFARQR